MKWKVLPLKKAKKTRATGVNDLSGTDGNMKCWVPKNKQNAFGWLKNAPEKAANCYICNSEQVWCSFVIPELNVCVALIFNRWTARIRSFKKKDRYLKVAILHVYNIHMYNVNLKCCVESFRDLIPPSPPPPPLRALHIVDALNTCENKCIPIVVSYSRCAWHVMLILVVTSALLLQ